jgi:hypothetical protein
MCFRFPTRLPHQKSSDMADQFQKSAEPDTVPASWRNPAAAHAPRTLVLAALGAIVGLGFAGYGLFTAKGTSTLLVPPEDVALVNQQPVSRVDYIAALQGSFATDFSHATQAQRRKVLDDMIREELFVQRGKELDLVSIDPEVRAALVRAVEQQAAMNAITAQPTAAKQRAYFNDHRDIYASEGTMTLRDLVFETLSAATAAAQALRSGQSPGIVVKTFKGRDSGKVNGEEFYFAAKIHLGDRLFEAARALQTGTISEPIDDSGVHVLVMIRNNPPVQLSFARAQSRVIEDLRRDAIARQQTNEEHFLRKRANILIAKDLRQ